MMAEQPHLAVAAAAAIAGAAAAAAADAQRRQVRLAKGVVRLREAALAPGPRLVAVAARPAV